MKSKLERNALPVTDEVYFREFYANHKSFIYLTAHKYTCILDECEDLVQETTIRLMRNVSALKDLDEAKTAKYIALTVKSVFLDYIKRNRIDKVVYVDDDTLTLLLAAQSPQRDIDTHLSSSFLVQRLKDELTPREWLILEGKYVMGFSQEELGKMLAIAPDSVRMALYRARTKAKKILNETKHCG